MGNNNLLPSLTIIVLLFSYFISQILSTSFKITNKCKHSIWPGLLSGAGTPQLPTTGFFLKSGDSRTIKVPPSWSGRLWGRTLCRYDSIGRFACATGDCGSGNVKCGGSGAAPPATLAEFTLNGAGNMDFYDVSMVDGYNVPILVLPKGENGEEVVCSATGCLVDLNLGCPKELGLYIAGGRKVGCRSACEAFGDPRYCCSGAYGTPDVCQPSVYSEFFKSACPRAYSYAYDDKTSTFTCPSTSYDYVIIFCPPPFTSQKLLGMHHKVGELPLVNTSTIYFASHHSVPVVNSFVSAFSAIAIITIMFL